MKDIEEHAFQREIHQMIKHFFLDKDRHLYVDIDAIEKVVWQYIQHRMGHEKISDANRYQIFTEILAKANIVIKAWQHNFEKELLKPSDTESSLVSYIESTYGKFR